MFDYCRVMKQADMPSCLEGEDKGKIALVTNRLVKVRILLLQRSFWVNVV